MFKLVGSTPSPYVRRLRLWLDDVDYEFIELDIYSESGSAALQKYNPAMKIPMLLDGEQPVYDSRVIFRYLSEKLGRAPLTLAEENQLTLIDAAVDANIILMMSARSGIDTQQDLLLCNLQRNRLAQTLPVLNNWVAEGVFNRWQYPAICLFCLLDWVSFRELLDLSDWPALEAFHRAQQSQPQVQATDPR